MFSMFSYNAPGNFIGGRSWLCTIGFPFLLVWTVESIIEFLVCVRPSATCLTYETEKSEVIVKSLTLGGVSQRSFDGQVS